MVKRAASRKLLFILFILITFLLSISLFKKNIESEITGNIIYISPYKFSPRTLSISKGATVTWINQDRKPHTIISEGLFVIKLEPGEQFNYKFADKGEYEYKDRRFRHMKGKIIVTESLKSLTGRVVNERKKKERVITI